MSNRLSPLLQPHVAVRAEGGLVAVEAGLRAILLDDVRVVRPPRLVRDSPGVVA